MGKNLETFALGLISAIALAIITQIIAHYFSRKSLKDQQEHSLKVVKMQLFHEDRKKALIKLDSLLKEYYPKFSDFRKTIDEYLDNSESMFIPLELRKKLAKQTLDLDSFLTERQMEIYGITDQDIGGGEEDEYESWAQDFPEQALDNEVKSRLSGLKSSMRDKIKDYVSEEK